MSNTITLKSVKVMRSLSEETLCYSANVFLNGKKIGSVSNHGHGGETSFTGKIDPEQVAGLDAKYVEMYNAVHTDPDDFHYRLYDDIVGRGAEHIITTVADTIAATADALKDFKKYKRKPYAFFDGGKQYIAARDKNVPASSFKAAVLEMDKYKGEEIHFSDEMSELEIMELIYSDQKELNFVSMEF